MEAATFLHRLVEEMKDHAQGDPRVTFWKDDAKYLVRQGHFTLIVEVDDVIDVQLTYRAAGSDDIERCHLIVLVGDDGSLVAFRSSEKQEDAKPPREWAGILLKWLAAGHIDCSN